MLRFGLKKRTGLGAHLRRHPNAAKHLRTSGNLRKPLALCQEFWILMSELQEVFLDTGERQYSGTGRNRQATRMVEQFNNYAAIPLSFEEIVSAHGKEIKTTKDLGLLATYWAQFKDCAPYNLVLYVQISSVCAGHEDRGHDSGSRHTRHKG